MWEMLSITVLPATGTTTQVENESISHTQRNFESGISSLRYSLVAIRHYKCIKSFFRIQPRSQKNLIFLRRPYNLAGDTTMLWDTSLLHSLPSRLLASLHREVCSIRSRGWGTLSSKRAKIYERGWNALCDYHTHVMAEMSERGWNYNRRWNDYSFRGAHNPELSETFLNDYTVLSPLYTDQEIEEQREALSRWEANHAK